MTHCRHIMLEELQRRNFAPTTISTYLHAVEQFARHFKCRPDRLNQTPLPDLPGVSAARAEDAPADRSPPCRGVAVLLREDAEAALPARRHAVSESPASAAADPERRGGRAGDRRRRQSVAPHDADGPVLDRHAERGAAPSAGRRHRQPADADPHPTRQRRTRSLRAAQPDAARRRCACTTGGCGRRRGCFRAPSTAGAPTSRSRRRSCGTPVSSRPGAPGSASAARRTCCAIRMPRTCSRVARTSGRFSCCSVTWRSGTRCSISISRRSICRPSRIRWTRSRSRGPTPRVGRALKHKR